MAKRNALKDVLKRHGVENAEKYLESRGSTVKVARSGDPDVYVRGSVQLMTGRKISRKEVEKRLEALKHL